MRGKSKPFSAAGLFFEMLSDVQSVPVTSITEAEAMALTERSLVAVGFIEMADGVWSHVD